MASGHRAASAPSASVASRASTLSRRAGAGTAHGARVFWRWSGDRPFWGGLLLVVAGAELFLSANMDLKGVQIHLGFSGFLSYLVPAILVLCGVFSWFTPAQRGFYAIIGTLTAVYSLIGLNFGGWFLGMLIGIAGGALSFAWSPAPASTSGASDAEDDTTVLVRPRTPEPGKPSPTRRRGEPPLRALAVLTVPLVLIATIGLHAGRSAAAVPITAPAIAVTPCPATPTPTSSASRNLQDYWNEFLEWLNENWQAFTGDLTAFWNWLTGKESVATPAPTASCGADGAGSPAGTGAAAPTVPADLPPGSTVVSAHPALLTSSRQTLKGFRYEGVVTLPTATGAIRVLKFSLSSATNADFRLIVDGPRPWVTNANPLVVSGDVLLYTSRFSGKLLGIPLTFTPDSPPPLALPLPNGQYLSVTLPEIVFTDVQLNLVLITCQQLTATGMSQAFA